MLIIMLIIMLTMGYEVARWRGHGDVQWTCAVALTLTALGEIIFDPAPYATGRALQVALLVLWLRLTVKAWDRSGVPCALHGHVWGITAKTPNGVFKVTAANPEHEARIMESLAPRLREQGVIGEPIVTRVCVVCERPPDDQGGT